MVAVLVGGTRWPFGVLVLASVDRDGRAARCAWCPAPMVVRNTHGTPPLWWRVGACTRRAGAPRCQATLHLRPSRLPLVDELQRRRTSAKERAGWRGYGQPMGDRGSTLRPRRVRRALTGKARVTPRGFLIGTVEAGQYTRYGPAATKPAHCPHEKRARPVSRHAGGAWAGAPRPRSDHRHGGDVSSAGGHRCPPSTACDGAPHGPLLPSVWRRPPELMAANATVVRVGWLVARRDCGGRLIGWCRRLAGNGAVGDVQPLRPWPPWPRSWLAGMLVRRGVVCVCFCGGLWPRCAVLVARYSYGCARQSWRASVAAAH